MPAKRNRTPSPAAKAKKAKQEEKKFTMQQDLIDAADGFLESAKVISYAEAVELWTSACDGPGVTANEFQTLEHILNTYAFTDKAKRYLSPLVTKQVSGKGLYKVINKVRYDRSCLDLADHLSKDGKIDLADAKLIWKDVQDGLGVTEVERRTVLHVMGSYRLTDGAQSFLKEQTDGPKFDFAAARSLSEKSWDVDMFKALCDYIKVANLSPAYDKEILTNGLQEKAIDILVKWVEAQKVPGLKMQVLTEKGRTPLIFMVMEGSDDDAETVMLYGHMDKQPHMLPWAEGLGPCDPVLKEGKLYGRGGADDGYAIFACVNALRMLSEQKLRRPRCVVLIEGSEESGSPDLPFYINKMQKDIRSPSLIICLDSGCGNYDQLWLTTSLRGVMCANLKVEVLTEGVHSGAASGTVPSSFRIMRQLLDRIEEASTGKVLLKSIQAEIPPSHLENAKKAAAVLGDKVIGAYPLLPGMNSMADSAKDALLRKAWHPTLSYTGVNGLPDCSVAGNVLRPQSTLSLSFRCPPTVDPNEVGRELKEVLEKDPPHNAKVTCHVKAAGAGWKAPDLAPWLSRAVNTASMQSFGSSALLWGEGGSIPFMGMLGKKFPRAQFVITGVLGPQSNAHGPNEFLEVNSMHNVTVSTAYILNTILDNKQDAEATPADGSYHAHTNADREFQVAAGVNSKTPCCV